MTRLSFIFVKHVKGVCDHTPTALAVLVGKPLFIVLVQRGFDYSPTAPTMPLDRAAWMSALKSYRFIFRTEVIPLSLPLWSSSVTLDKELRYRYSGLLIVHLSCQPCVLIRLLVCNPSSFLNCKKNHQAWDWNRTVLNIKKWSMFVNEVLLFDSDFLFVA